MTAIKQAMILAAGLGNRMRPLTDDKPKPMIAVNGKSIIDYAIDSLRAIGIETIVANAHYKSEILEPHLKEKGVTVSHEETLLDTGGGIKKALTLFDRALPLLIVSGDSILVGDEPLRDLCAAWNDKTMDMLLSLQPLETMILTPGVGDYDLVNGAPKRNKQKSGRYMWNSARIINPAIFDHTPDGPFSFLTLMDACEARGRLAACVNNGVWHHLTTPDDVKRVGGA
jgi:MurNAc alpha-1-phosphate uridylyltransferase